VDCSQHVDNEREIFIVGCNGRMNSDVP